MCGVSAHVDGRVDAEYCYRTVAVVGWVFVPPLGAVIVLVVAKPTY